MNYTLHLPDNYVPPHLPGGKVWVTALRSGEYQQCTGQLCDGTGYCCLGVLSKVQGRLTDQGTDDGYRAVLANSNPLASKLKNDGEFPAGVQCSSDQRSRLGLVDCNDAGLTFPQIADIIEAVWACE